MTWQVHRIHRLPLEPVEECSECAINARYKQQHATIMAETGDAFHSQITTLMEANRVEWLEFYRVSPQEVVKHDKPKKFQQFVKTHHNETVTINQIMNEVGCAQGTAYAYIRELPLSFRRIGTSTYLVRDEARVRAEALAARGSTLPQDQPNAVEVPLGTGSPLTAIPPPRAMPSKP